jgi:hypothetical protein
MVEILGIDHDSLKEAMNVWHQNGEYEEYMIVYYKHFNNFKNKFEVWLNRNSDSPETNSSQNLASNSNIHRKNPMNIEN